MSDAESSLQCYALSAMLPVDGGLPAAVSVITIIYRYNASFADYGGLTEPSLMPASQPACYGNRIVFIYKLEFID